jgi:hypothetical protein
MAMIAIGVVGGGQWEDGGKVERRMVDEGRSAETVRCGRCVHRQCRATKRHGTKEMSKEKGRAPR